MVNDAHRRAGVNKNTCLRDYLILVTNRQQQQSDSVRAEADQSAGARSEARFRTKCGRANGRLDNGHGASETPVAGTER